MLPSNSQPYKVSHVYCGSDVAGAVTLRNSAFIWGNNWLKSSKPNRLPQRLNCKFKVQSLAIGARHLVVLSQEGRVYVMGENQRFQLGMGSNEEVKSQLVLQPLSSSDVEDEPAPASPVASRTSVLLNRTSSSTTIRQDAVGDPTKKTFRLGSGMKAFKSVLQKKAGPHHSSSHLSAAAVAESDFIQVKQIAAGCSSFLSSFFSSCSSFFFFQATHIPLY